MRRACWRGPAHARSAKGHSIQLVVKLSRSPDRATRKLEKVRVDHHQPRYGAMFGGHTLSAHGTLPASRVLFDPFHDAMLDAVSRGGVESHAWTNHMEVVTAFARYYTDVSNKTFHKVKNAYTGYSRRQDTCTLDKCRQSAPDRYRRHRPLGCPSARSRRCSTP